jgi:hypothetical protein
MDRPFPAKFVWIAYRSSKYACSVLLSRAQHALRQTFSQPALASAPAPGPRLRREVEMADWMVEFRYPDWKEEMLWPGYQPMRCERWRWVSLGKS